MQILFWIPAVLTILLVAVLWHVYRENRLGQINVDQQNEATKRKETEEKLRGYLNLLDTLINTIPNPI
jgi:hypothetical protein